MKKVESQQNVLSLIALITNQLYGLAHSYVWLERMTIDFPDSSIASTANKLGAVAYSQAGFYRDMAEKCAAELNKPSAPTTEELSALLSHLGLGGSEEN